MNLSANRPVLMAKRRPITDPLERRLAAHARRIFVKNRYASGKSPQVTMAADMGISQGYLSAVMNETKAAALDFLLGLARASGESLDYLALKNPEPEWYISGAQNRPPTEGPTTHPRTSPRRASRGGTATAKYDHAH